MNCDIKNEKEKLKIMMILKYKIITEIGTQRKKY
jgi:hypothetical protein